MSIYNKERIIMSSLWFWTYIMFYITKCKNIIMKLCFTYIPDSMFRFIYFITSLTLHTQHPIILEIKIHKNITTKDDVFENMLDLKWDYDITNKFNTILDLKWDYDILNENDELSGGLNVCDILDIYPMLYDSIMWVVYILEPHNVFKKTLDKNNHIKYMIIDLKNNNIFRSPNLNNEKKIICGEIPF
jgi:hypothetical protein